MSLGKNVFYLLITLVILIIYTVSTFNYKTILNNSSQVTSFSSEDSMFGEYADLLITKVNELKSKVLKQVGLDSSDIIAENKEAISIELVKENGVILMNGIFKNEEQAKSIVDLLNINRNGEYKFEENRLKDVVILNKVSLLMDSFKEFFADGSKLLIVNEEILLSGELKDSNFKPLLTSIITKSNLNVSMDIKQPTKSKTEEIIENIKKIVQTPNEDILKVQSSNEYEDKLNKLEKIKSSAVIQAQERIDSFTSNKKITFKRRSTSISDDSEETVKEIANILLEDSTLEVEIAGHTDSRGRASLNKRISQDRANSVKNALVELGVAAKSIKAIGYGEDFPIAKDDVNGLSEINRRVEFIVGDNK